MTWVLERRPELLDAAIEARPFALSLLFGDPWSRAFAARSW
jgi:hypothetical protein